jgi:hypothetical protein
MTRAERALLPLLGLLAASVSLGLGFGFMVDDALITTRVAHQIASSGHYRFNPTGPRVDAVTPLGFAWISVPFAHAGSLEAFRCLRWLGAACHLATGWVLGYGMRNVLAHDPSSVEVRRRLMLAAAALLPLACNLAWGAWGGSGMETPFVTLFCTLALLTQRGSAIWIALATAWRPELVPWGLALAAARAETRKQRVVAVCVSALGPALVVALRLMLFGHPAPLAIFAKPSDLDSGLGYVFAGMRLLGVPLLLIATRAWRGQPRLVYAATLAAAVHLVALCSAGGDWMPYFRLWVPILPGLAWIGYGVMLRGKAWPNVVRAACATGMSLLLCASSGGAARQIVGARVELIEAAKPLLASAWNVGALDVGWVGAATSANITDFAGVTDPNIAHLPGGHTSKRLPSDLLQRLEIDVLVLLIAPDVDVEELERVHWTALPFARTVESRVARLDAAREFVPVALLPLRGTTQHYLVLRRAHARFAGSGLDFSGRYVSRRPPASVR